MNIIVFTDKKNEKSYLNIWYDIHEKKFWYFVANDIKKATIFDKEYIDKSTNSFILRYGPKYLSYNQNNMISLSDDPRIFKSIDNYLTCIYGNHKLCESNLHFVNINDRDINDVYATLEIYTFEKPAEIYNLVVFDYFNDDIHVAYLKSKTETKFKEVSTLKTLNHIFHARKHTWFMYLGLPSLEKSSIVDELKSYIDHYLKAEKIVRVFGFGYGGAIATKALESSQSEQSLSYHGYLSKEHFENLYIYTFGSYLISDNPKIKQYMLPNDENLPKYTRLIKPNENNKFFKDDLLIDNLQNIIWINNFESNDVFTYLDLIVKLLNKQFIEL